MKIEQRIKELRTRFGLTQWELSQKIKMSDSYIAHIEMGRRSPCLKFAFKIEKALNLKSGEFSRLVVDAIREEAERELQVEKV